MRISNDTKDDNLVNSLTESSEDTRIMAYFPLDSPENLQRSIVQTEESKYFVNQSRKIVKDILNGDDDRLLVIVGPCSLHDTEIALDYAALLKAEIEKFKDSLYIVMRAYLEKPRTVVGWKGLINDPMLDGSKKVNLGLNISRDLFRKISNMNIPIATELLDTISPQYYADFVTIGAIGARTTESQLHRELASGLSFPVGFKNATNGSLDVAVDAIKATSHSHTFIGLTKKGQVATTVTRGNADTFIILRGGSSGPNYDEISVGKAAAGLKKANLPERVVIDFSHGNSQKQHLNQIKVADSVSKQLSSNSRAICGAMIESHINEGRQDIPEQGPDFLKYGVSITDACISMEQTRQVLSKLAEGVINRRKF